MNISNRQESGLFVQAFLNGTPASCLIDTGATLSILSTQVWERMHNKQTLESYQCNILSASGTELDVKGKTQITININEINCHMDVIVADIVDGDAILGLDFMKTNNVVINVCENEMTIQGM